MTVPWFMILQCLIYDMPLLGMTLNGFNDITINLIIIMMIYDITLDYGIIMVVVYDTINCDDMMICDVTLVFMKSHLIVTA